MGGGRLALYVSLVRLSQKLERLTGFGHATVGSLQSLLSLDIGMVSFGEHILGYDVELARVGNIEPAAHILLE
jgi:hypothetical protein